MTREEIALQAMLSLMTVHWDVEFEYETADALIQSQIETAFQYADKFLEFCEKDRSIKEKEYEELHVCHSSKYKKFINGKPNPYLESKCVFAARVMDKKCKGCVRK